MPWTLLLNTRVLAGAAALIAFFGICAGFYVKGRSDANAKHEMQMKDAQIEALANVRAVERQKSAEVEGVANEYETKLRTLSDRAALAERDLGRLRVKIRSCADMPKSATSSGKPDATANTGTDRHGSGEINLDDAAREIVRLGSDLDAANLKIIELQEL
ncbi:MAG: hypothetical protein LLG06_04195, partial [Desulfobacteraceae bacterium]|nr:hypothetical protein [Desulfobacteraceae bacterium]